MTKDKDFKRLVRDRAARTGERYAAARRRLVEAGEGSAELAGLAFAHHQLLEGPVDGWWGDMRVLLEGLDDDEYLWQPVPGCLTVRRRASGEVVRDRSADQSPLATIAWHVAGMTHLLTMRTNAHFGDRRLTWIELETADTAARGLERLDAAHAAWREALAGADPRMLAQASEGPPRMIDGDFPFIQVVLHTAQLLQAAGAQIVQLRRLYARRAELP